VHDRAENKSVPYQIGRWENRERKIKKFGGGKSGEKECNPISLLEIVTPRDWKKGRGSSGKDLEKGLPGAVEGHSLQNTQPRMKKGKRKRGEETAKDLPKRKKTATLILKIVSTEPWEEKTPIREAKRKTQGRH